MSNEGSGRSLASAPVWILAAAISAAVAAAIVAVADRPGAWASWRPATCLPDRCFCELRRAGLVAQPANTLSSLFFLVPGLALVLSPILDRGARHSSQAPWFGTGLIAIGLGSAFYHASLSFVGQTFDVAGMYLVATWAFVAALGRRVELSRTRATGLWLGLNGALVALLVFAPALRRWLFAAVVVALVGLELAGWSGASSRARRLLLATVGIAAAGFAVWALDLTRILCRPEGLVQGHALWHAASAVSATLLYRYLLARTAADVVRIP